MSLPGFRWIQKLALASAALSGMVLMAGTALAQTPPPWAYALNPPPVAGARPPADDGQPKRLTGSGVALTMAQIRDAFNPPDWYPDDHTQMPAVVLHGRKPEVLACGYCHLPNGQGRPENAGIAGLPAAYIVQQMSDYRNGRRKSAEPRMLPPALMAAIGKAASEAEAMEAAQYFSSLTFRPWIRVVETGTVPRTKVSGWMLVSEEQGTEPIGSRIIETPENLERTELRDSKSGFIAYVPVGSIHKGEALVKTGGAGKTIACVICHGEDLKGLGVVPPLAGRSPSYVVRQLNDIKTGNRDGLWTPLMKEAVSKLTLDDMIAIAAYTLRGGLERY